MEVRRHEHKAEWRSTVRESVPSANMWLLAIVLVSLLWRLPSLFDPPWVNDEGTYFAIARAMAHGYRLYADVWENKPPGIYLLYSAVYHSFGSSVFALRVIATLLTVALVLLIFRLALDAVGAMGAAIASLAAGLLLGVPFLEGTTLNAELPLAVATAAGVYLANNQDRPASAGICMSVAVAFKAVACFDAASLGIWIFLHCRSLLPRYMFGVSLVVALGCLAAWRAGILGPMMHDALLYDLGYVGHGNGGSVPWLLAPKALALALATLALRRASFFHLWAVYAVVGALFSGRVFGHYALQAIVPLTLSSVVLARRLISRGLLVALPTVFVAAAVASAALGWGMAASGHDSILARRLQYYANFGRYALHTESFAQYSAQIDDHVNRNRKVATMTAALPAGKLLVWGNTPWIYVLSGRLPATPYTSSLRQPEVPGETVALQSAVRRRSPAVLIVIDPPAPPLGAAGRQLKHGYRLDGSASNARIYTRVSAP